MKISGCAWVFGDHVDTDAIVPARYLSSSDPAELAAHCMEDIDPRFSSAVQRGDILVAGENFGCGSSREHAPLAIQGAGVSCVIAASYARIFFRNALNIGLPIVVCPHAVERARHGDVLDVDVAEGIVVNRTQGTRHAIDPFPPFLMALIEAGGLMPLTKQRLVERSHGLSRPSTSDAS